MLRLRFLLVFLIGWLAIFYNVERADEALNIATFVYVLILVLSFPLFLAPRLFIKQPAATGAVALGVYAVLKIVLQYPVGGPALPITVVEVAGILLTILLFRQISLILIDFEDTIASITINLLGIPPRLADGDLEEVYREVRRARRFKQPLTLAVVKANYNDASVDINQIVAEIQRGMRNSFLQARLIRLLAHNLHESDTIVRHNEELVIALPQISADEARRMFENANLQTMQWGLPLHVGLSTFPESGTTLQTLLEVARSEVHQIEIKPDSATDPTLWPNSA